MQPWVMRPWRSTWVASTTTIAAPELDSMARWPRCQSVAEPSSVLVLSPRPSPLTPPTALGYDECCTFAAGKVADALGPLFATPLVPLTLLLVPIATWLLFRTPFGLRLRATGELPAASAVLGLSVSRLRYSGVLLSGAFAGLAGAWLASEQHSFTDGMTSGRGYIAIAAMIVGKWHPAGAAAACLLFGMTEAAQIALQGSGFPSPLLQALPYAVTMLALAGFIGRATPPKALGTPYDPDHV